MKDHECSIVDDILPLYVENVIGDDTKQFVDAHLSHCVECSKELARIKTELPLGGSAQETDHSVQVMKKIGRNIKKKRVFTAIVSAVISAIVVIVAFAYLTAPVYLPYREALDRITAYDGNGHVILSFAGEYELSQSGQGIYALSLYDTAWNELTEATPKQVIAVNPEGEDVKTVYYLSNGEQEDRVIYGENPVSNGGVITLPRLFLNYYLKMAALIAFALAVLLLLCRRKPKAKTIIAKILFAPISYIVSHVIITGLNGTSYSATRDFCLILLLAIPLYFLFYLLYQRKAHLGAEYARG